MKKLVLALFAVSAIATANAQKNTILVYGSVGAGFSNTDLGTPGNIGTATSADHNTSNYFVAPGIGYQFSKHMTVGLQGSWMRMKDQMLQAQVNNFTMSNTTVNSEWQLGGFFRYTEYLSNLFSVYGQVNAGYVSGEMDTRNRVSTANYVSDEAKYDGLQAQIFPAFAINVHKGWALNFAFGGVEYRMLSAEENPGNMLGFNHSNDLDFTFGQQFNLTITKNIGCNWGRRTTGGRMVPGTELRRRRMDIGDDEEEETPKTRDNDDEDDE